MSFINCIRSGALIKDIDFSRCTAEVGEVGYRYACFINGQKTNYWLEKEKSLLKLK